jgi:hypothetical protein
MLQKFCSSLVRASVFIKKLTLVSTSWAWKKRHDHLRATIKDLHSQEDNLIPQVNYLNALEAGKSQWDESSRDDTRPFWNIFMTRCRRLTNTQTIARCLQASNKLKMGWIKTTILWYSVFLKPCCDMSPSIATQGGKKSHRNGSIHLVPALDARAQTSNTRHSDTQAISWWGI